MERSREGLAWCAGFFDGEGCTRLNGTAPVIQIHQKVEHDMTGRIVLDRLRSETGIGKMLGPYGPYGNQSMWKSQRQAQWCFMITGFEECQAFIAMVWPWLGPIKKKQAAAAFAACISRRQRRRH